MLQVCLLSAKAQAHQLPRRRLIRWKDPDFTGKKPKNYDGMAAALPGCKQIHLSYFTFCCETKGLRVRLFENSLMASTRGHSVSQAGRHDLAKNITECAGQ